MKRIMVVLSLNDADEGLSPDAMEAMKRVLGCGCCSAGHPVVIHTAVWADDAYRQYNEHVQSHRRHGR